MEGREARRKKGEANGGKKEIGRGRQRRGKKREMAGRGDQAAGQQIPQDVSGAAPFVGARELMKIK